MATLYDLAMQYLNQSLPKTFKYDRTNPPTIGPIIRPPQDPNAPTARILPVQGGGGGGGGGSNNPYDLSTDFSQITSDRQKRLSQDPTGLNKFLIDTLGMQKPQTAEDIVNLGYRTPSKFGIGALLPDKYGELPRADQAFIASRMGYTGPTVFGANDSGLSKDPFGLNTRSAFGNYAERVGVEAEKLGKSLEKSAAKKGLSFDPATGKVTGGTPAEIAAWEKQTSMLNTKFDFYTKEDVAYKDYQNQVQDVLDADKEFSTDGDSSNYGIDGYPTYDIKDIQGEDEEDGEVTFDPTKIGINTLSTKNPFEINNIVELQKQQDAIKQQELINQNAMDPGTVVDNSAPPNNNPNEDHDGDGVPNNVEAAGGSYDGGYQGAEGGFEYTGDFGDPYSDDNFMAGDNSSADPTGTGNFSDQVTGNDTSPGATGGEGGAGTGGSTKIVCTMMNESYGFGSFRNKIWMKFHKDLSPEYQKGYHKLFLPLVRIAKTNKVVKKILEHIAVHSTIDMRQATRGKMHLLGRIYRKILLPLCYFVGKHG